MGFFNLDLKREMESAQDEFGVLHDAIFNLVEPIIPDDTKTLSKDQRDALEAFQNEAIKRVKRARSQATKAQRLTVEYLSTSGPLLYRRPRSKKANLWWQGKIESLNQLEIVFGLLMGPYEKGSDGIGG